MSRACSAAVLANIRRQYHAQHTKRWFRSIPVVDVGPLVKGEQVSQQAVNRMLTPA